MTLGDKSRMFTRLVTLRLFPWIYERGYEVTFGEAWRPSDVAHLYEKQGRGIGRSAHTNRLAIDINLYRDGVYLDKTEDYEGVGVYWESLSTYEYVCTWGGRFNDGNHFSIFHEGVK